MFLSSSFLVAFDFLVIWTQLTQVIKHVHDQGYVHRDIKSDNILISYQNRTYNSILIDFGKCVKLTDARTKQLTIEEQQSYKEKHRHIAPEIVDGSLPPSIASDIHSLGRVINSVGVKQKCSFILTVGEKCMHVSPQKRLTSEEVAASLTQYQ